MRAVRAWLFTATLAGWGVGTPLGAATEIELEPSVGGPYAVACSNVDQDFSRASGAVSSYWTGTRSARSRYVSELLMDPEHTLRFTVRPPNDRDLFSNFRNREVEYVALVCYPTHPDNPRADFVLPDGRVVPAMQRGGEEPIFADACDVLMPEACTMPSRQWPLLVYSHGLGGSPLSGTYLSTLLRFASHGYVVAAPFHADPRFSRIRLRDFGDLYYLLTQHSQVVEMQAIRPLAIRGLLDLVLEHPHYANHIDPERIAGFGASLGGQTLMLAAGAELTHTLQRDRKQVLHEERIKAVVTYLPYSGVDQLPSFGSSQRGVRGVDVAYLGIAGTADDVAPLDLTREAVDQLNGTRYLIAVRGLGHASHPAVMDEAYAWYLAFLDANLNGDREALSRLYRATRVAGGVDDYLEIAVQGAVPALPGETVVREFHHTGLGHYFRTANPNEADGLIRHPERGWTVTGNDFAAFARDDDESGVDPVCRFYGHPVIGPNSHFYTAWASECAFLLALEAATPPGQPKWHFEEIAFSTHLPDAAGNCPDEAPFPVWRAYNGGVGAIENGRRKDPNHRYATQRQLVQELIDAGWIDEGVAFCSAAPLRVPTNAAH